jgi:hypothetical protein
MRGLIIQRRSAVTDAVRWLAAGFPARLTRFWRGPAANARLTASGLGAVEGAGWLRPVDLTVAPEAMLPMRLVIPTEGRHELSHAIALAIRQDTPFEPEELVVQAVEVERGGGSETYAIHAVPRRLVSEARKSLGHQRLGRITTMAGGPDLAAAVIPLRRFSPWLVAFPLLVIALVGVVSSYQVLAEQDRRVAELETQTSSVLTELRQVSAELEALETRAAAGNLVTAALTAELPALVLLERARQQLGEAAEVTQVELRDGELRLSLRTPDVLAEMARFADAGWAAAIEGAITADPVASREIATLRLAPGKAD